MLLPLRASKKPATEIKTPRVCVFKAPGLTAEQNFVWEVVHFLKASAPTFVKTAGGKTFLSVRGCDTRMQALLKEKAGIEERRCYSLPQDVEAIKGMLRAYVPPELWGKKWSRLLAKTDGKT